MLQEVIQSDKHYKHSPPRFLHNVSSLSVYSRNSLRQTLLHPTLSLLLKPNSTLPLPLKPNSTLYPTPTSYLSLTLYPYFHPEGHQKAVN